MANLISYNELQEQLRDCEIIDDYEKLKKNDYLVYFEVVGDMYKYRKGGNLLINKAPDYLVLVSGSHKWSVQLDTNTVYRRKESRETRKAFEEEKNRLIALLEHMSAKNRKLVENNKKLEQMVIDRDVQLLKMKQRPTKRKSRVVSVSRKRT